LTHVDVTNFGNIPDGGGTHRRTPGEVGLLGSLWLWRSSAVSVAFALGITV
jgi:hypothetical protein